jgi:hypothetical protein
LSLSCNGLAEDCPVLGRLALATSIILTVAPARAFWEGIDRQAVMAVIDLSGGEKLLFRSIRVHDFEGGDESRSVCGEVWFDGTSEYVRFVLLFGRFADRPEPIGLPLVGDLTESRAGLDGLWASFCRDVPRLPTARTATAMAVD